MNAYKTVTLETIKNGRSYTFAIPELATYPEAIEVAKEMVAQVELLAKGFEDAQKRAAEANESEAQSAM